MAGQLAAPRFALGSQCESVQTTAPSLLRRLGLMAQVAGERRALAKATPEMLRDMGVSPEQAAAEAARPFWDLPCKR